MIAYTIFTSYTQLPILWDNKVSHDVFLQSPYLNALENGLPNNIKMYYLGFFSKKELVGVAITQYVMFEAEKAIRTTESSKMKSLLKKNASKLLKGNILVIGNLMHTGQHGIYFNEKKISATPFFNTLFNSVENLRQNLKKQFSRPIYMTLFKDYFNEDSLLLEPVFNKNQFYKTSVQPNMILPIKDSWNTVDDYLANMTTKYRTRYKRARKKLNGIISKEITLEELKNNEETIYNLYKNVSDKASFNSFVLPENHFYELKKKLNHKFRVFGYFLNSELVGFYTLVLNHNVLETYLLGYNDNQQKLKQLYLNMLYDMVSFAIENNFTSVVYARTAMEIKSSVGALPKEMVMFMKHNNNVANSLFKPLFRFMNPSIEWKERHPFKE